MPLILNTISRELCSLESPTPMLIMWRSIDYNPLPQILLTRCSSLWDNLKEEMLDPQPDTSSDDEDDEAHESTVLPPGEHVLMGFGSSVDVIALHPSVVHIFRLWQIFLDNVNPLVKSFHAPTVQQMIIDASGDMATLSKPNEALLFSIYFLAVLSLTNVECENHFSESRQKLLARYIRGVQQALVNAKVLRSLNLTTLQAFSLFLTGARRVYDPHTVWTLTGVAVRIAQRLGIHTDIASSRLSPFDAEMRRRTWWQIVFLDGHASKLAGAPFPAVGTLFRSIEFVVYSYVDFTFLQAHC